MNNISKDIKVSMNGDEYFSPQNVVDMIVPYILKSKYRTIWCPFDKEDSRFVVTFKDLGYDVVHGHIDTGQDFFRYTEPQGEIVVSNPPFSKRTEILKKLFQMDLPFALVTNSNGLFDAKPRIRLFRENGVQLLIPYGRMKFFRKADGFMTHPNFQSIYVCNKLLDKQIEFSDSVF